jgi:UDP-N-acetylmuramyl pentapeptide synthase
MPAWLVVANALLAPYEQAVQRGYEADAVRRLADVRPFIIGITGSYGKSSTKSMLAHILQFKGPTLASTGSINTLMGNTRHIREHLVYGHQYMVVEMGAYYIGSIRRLCALTPPAAAIVTAVGDAHLERVGSLENIVTAKSELAQAVPSGGLLVVNADYPGALRIGRSVTDRHLLLYGESTTGAAHAQRAVCVLHAAPRPADRVEPRRGVHAGGGPRRRPGGRDRVVSYPEAGGEPARGGRGWRHRLGTGRVQLESIRVCWSRRG